MRVLFLSALLLLSACASPSHPNGRSFTGVYAEGPELMTFRADGETETWSVAGGAGVVMLQSAAPRHYSADGRERASFSVRAEVRGVLSRPGRYGHLGLFAREITINEVVQVLDAEAR